MSVRVSVFDVAGRQIRTLEDRSVPAGWHAVQWDGRDASGRAVAAGIYFVRLRGDGVDETGKVTLLRKRP
jgi:flagellar hook assembly protein FlgD